jgi:hypothetical protein
LQRARLAREVTCLFGGQRARGHAEEGCRGAPRLHAEDLNRHKRSARGGAERVRQRQRGDVSQRRRNDPADAGDEQQRAVGAGRDTGAAVERERGKYGRCLGERHKSDRFEGHCRRRDDGDLYVERRGGGTSLGELELVEKG